MYTRDAQNWDDEYLRYLRLTTRNDITTMPLQVEDQFWFRASTHDRNEADRIADKLQLPQHRGYVWHALNASYDWQARMQKPGRLASYQELQQEINMPTPNLENTTCLLAYYEIWRELYALGMGDDLDKVWYNPAYNGTAKIAAAQTDVDSQRARYEEELDERQAREEANRILNEKASNRKKLQFRQQIEMLNEKHAKMPETPSKISLKRKRTRRSDPDENQNKWSWPDTPN
ncbi:hypothetical protein SARC_09232 [Sphaeroforma arctica JP610]|uniref:Uncharacterized protein n=1 Tax=Sphaeroforma arctica JP610 TaxID=667725 RepID=A0A0L0FNF3_9EUKA|nr:hypothetical protein SARC_09232 [Sphaeroforma arctica JP610]KNC78335.1 hypothetical protein SARC_09232 [Sphaeroforma arctica JP610]|eukprot:XP_014152237.1 hypothetical protein SARC_09232 [Sphaeroforma arctica JP610]